MYINDHCEYEKDTFWFTNDFFFYSGKGSGLGSLASSQSVSFRQGTNVEFGSNTFNANGGGGTAEPLDVAYSLDPISNKNRDFHNPMYDAVQNNADSVGNGSSGNFLI